MITADICYCLFCQRDVSPRHPKRLTCSARCQKLFESELLFHWAHPEAHDLHDAYLRLTEHVVLTRRVAGRNVATALGLTQARELVHAALEHRGLSHDTHFRLLRSWLKLRKGAGHAPALV